jgi:hypothetical protein
MTVRVKGSTHYYVIRQYTLTTNDVVFDHAANVDRTEVFAWSTNGSAVSNLVSTRETSVDGLTNWST